MKPKIGAGISALPDGPNFMNEFDVLVDFLFELQLEKDRNVVQRKNAIMQAVKEHMKP